MPTLTRGQIEVYARAAGLPGPLFASIALAESSGRTDIVNSIGCVGLWQINQPVHVKDHPTWSTGWLKDPANNAAAAKVLYRQSGLLPWISSAPKWTLDNAWSTFRRGGGSVVEQFERKFGGVTDVVGDVTGGVTDVAGSALRLVDVAERTGTWVSTPANWARVAYVGGGLVLVAVAANMAVTWPAAGRVARTVAGTTVKRVRGTT